MIKSVTMGEGVKKCPKLRYVIYGQSLNHESLSSYLSILYFSLSLSFNIWCFDKRRKGCQGLWDDSTKSMMMWWVVDKIIQIFVTSFKMTHFCTMISFTLYVFTFSTEIFLTQSLGQVLFICFLFFFFLFFTSLFNSLYPF